MTDPSIWNPASEIITIENPADTALRTDLQTDLVTSKGANLVGYKAADTNAEQTNLHEVANRRRHLFDFCSAAKIAAIKAGTLTNVDDEIEDLLNAVCPLVVSAVDPLLNINAGTAILPGKCFLLVTDTINCTATRVVGTRTRDFLKITSDDEGCIIVGQTGAGTAILEVSGAQWFTITRGITLDTTLATADKSTIGIYSGVPAVLQQSQNHKIECRITLHDDATANNGGGTALGTVAFYNFGSEEWTPDTVYWSANCACILTSNNTAAAGPGSVGGAGAFMYSSLVTGGLASTHSLGVVTFVGECFLEGLNRRVAPLLIQNITAPDFQNTYIVGSGVGGANMSAINFFGNAINMRFKGLIENLETLTFNGSAANSTFDITWGTVTNTAEPMIRVNRANTAYLDNCRFMLDVEGNPTTRKVISTVDGNEVLTSNFKISRTTITAWRSDGVVFANADCHIPLNVLQNIGSGQSAIFGAAAQIENCSFMAGLTASAANVTGAGTVFSLNASAWTELYDNGAAFDVATGIFVAPMNGTYEFGAVLDCIGGTAVMYAGTLQLRRTDSAGVLIQHYVLENVVPLAIARIGGGGVGEFSIGGTTQIPMNAADQCFLRYTVSGGAGDTVQVNSGGAAVEWRTRFYGKKVL